MLQNKNFKNQNGNAILFILIAVFLFGALAFSFSRSARDGSSNISKQQTKIAAQEILNYARIIEGAVNRVRRNGCSETEITFENSVVGGYSNPDAPIDKSCHIFEPEGGRALVLTPSSLIDSKKIFTLPWSHYVYGMDADFIGIGTNGTNSENSELYLLLAISNPQICNEINKLLGLPTGTSTPDDSGVSHLVGLFKGDFIAPLSSMGDEAGSSILSNINAACYIDNDQANHYAYYHVLLAR